MSPWVDSSISFISNDKRSDPANQEDAAAETKNGNISGKFTESVELIKTLC
jgi:hypothetical protein